MLRHARRQLRLPNPYRSNYISPSSNCLQLNVHQPTPKNQNVNPIQKKREALTLPSLALPLASAFALGLASAFGAVLGAMADEFEWSPVASFRLRSVLLGRKQVDVFKNKNKKKIEGLVWRETQKKKPSGFGIPSSVVPKQQALSPRMLPLEDLDHPKHTGSIV